MSMLVMNIWVMRMAVREGCVSVLVRMGFASGPWKIVFVLVMRVVHMTMCVGDHLMRVHVLVAFGQMEPYSQRHERRRNPE